MGSTGKTKIVKGDNDSLVNKPTNDTEKYTVFDSSTGAQKWFDNPKLSNSSVWKDELTEQEQEGITAYTGNSYSNLNSLLYGTPWENMDGWYKQLASNIYEGLNKFELHHGISVDRATSTIMFGKSHMSVDAVKESLLKNPVRQHNGFMSFSTDQGGHGIKGEELIVTLKVPPSVGAGAYVRPLSHVKGENEFLVNSNAVVRYDPNSVTKDALGRIHVTGYWLGQGSDQVFEK